MSNSLLNQRYHQCFIRGRKILTNDYLAILCTMKTRFGYRVYPGHALQKLLSRRDIYKQDIRYLGSIEYAIGLSLLLYT